MKLKTILGVIACAGACASFSAFANTTNAWFDATVGVDSVTTTNVNITATNGEAIASFTYDNSMIVLDDDMESLRFTPINSANSDGLVTLTASAVLTPCDKSDLEPIDDAKTGFAVGVDGSSTNFYGYVAGGWLALSGTVPSTVETTAINFKLEINYRDGTVQFVYDGAYLSENNTNVFNLAGAASTLAHVDVWGNGKIASVGSMFEVAVAAYDGNKYGSIAEAVAAAKAVDPSVDPSTVVESVAPDGTAQAVSATAANGLNLVVCQALGLATNDANANIRVAPVAEDTDSDNITLCVTNVGDAPEGGVVGYRVSPGDTVYETPAAVRIPLTAGTYTITPVLK